MANTSTMINFLKLYRLTGMLSHLCSAQFCVLQIKLEFVFKIKMANLAAVSLSLECIF